MLAICLLNLINIFHLMSNKQYSIVHCQINVTWCSTYVFPNHMFLLTEMVICLDAEFLFHYFLHSTSFNVERWTLLNITNESDSVISKNIESILTRVLLYGNKFFKYEGSPQILNAANDFVFFAKRIVETIDKFAIIHRGWIKTISTL